MGPEHTNRTVWFCPPDGNEPVELGKLLDSEFIPAYGKPVKVVFKNGGVVTTIASPDDVFTIPTEDEAALRNIDLTEVL